MKLADARARLGKRLVEFPFTPVEDRQDLHTLAKALERFSPTIALEEADHPESLLLDITGLAPLFGKEHILAKRLASVLSKQNLTARIAVAPTVGMAWGWLISLRKR